MTASIKARSASSAMMPVPYFVQNESEQSLHGLNQAQSSSLSAGILAQQYTISRATKKTVTTRINAFDTPFAYRDFLEIAEKASHIRDTIVHPKVHHPSSLSDSL